MMTRLLLALLIALPLAAQDSPLFPRLTIAGGAYRGDFATNVRLDPDAAGGEGTQIQLERDLGLQRAKTLTRLTAAWMPGARHELAAAYFATSRNGLQVINRDITFRNRVYPVNATVTTGFDFDYWSAAYTFWARRGARDGLGLTLGAAGLKLDALVGVQRPDLTVTATESAKTNVPVALGGVQGRWALGGRVLTAASASMLPRVRISGYTGRVVTANAQIEVRPLRWLGVGAAYNHFKLDVDVARDTLHGAIGMRIRGPEGFVRLAW
jgi:hypothetical protein